MGSNEQGRSTRTRSYVRGTYVRPHVRQERATSFPLLRCDNDDDSIPSYPIRQDSADVSPAVSATVRQQPRGSLLGHPYPMTQQAKSRVVSVRGYPYGSTSGVPSVQYGVRKYRYGTNMTATTAFTFARRTVP